MKLRVYLHQLPFILNFMLGSTQLDSERSVFSLNLSEDIHILENYIHAGFCHPINNMLPTKFTLHTRDKGENVSVATADQTQTIFNGNINPEKDVIIIVHEYLRGCDKKFTQDSLKALLQVRDVQVVTVCWKAGFPMLESLVGKWLGALGYGLSIHLVPCVADLIALFMNRIHEELGVPWEKITIITHSLGCQLAGGAGNRVGGKLGKIVALDPAVPFYVPRPFFSSLLTDKSAQNVIVLHTSIGQMNMGTADFYANSLLNQPGCEIFLRNVLFPSTSFLDFLLCNHSRSIELFLESVLNATAFPAVECSSFLNFELGFCQGNNIAYFGLDTNARGTFYFTTTDVKPFY